jgi:hypothetical protein
MGYKTEVHSNQFIVGSVDKHYNFSINTRPVVHPDYQTALTEAKRLAGVFPDKKFIVLALVAVASTEPKPVPPVQVTYSL